LFLHPVKVKLLSIFLSPLSNHPLKQLSFLLDFRVLLLLHH